MRAEPLGGDPLPGPQENVAVMPGFGERGQRVRGKVVVAVVAVVAVVPGTWEEWDGGRVKPAYFT